MKILHLDSSLRFEGSVSREISAAVVARWHQTEPTLEVIRRDLAVDPPQHMDGALLAALKEGGAPSDERLAHEWALTETLLEELISCDALVIGAPMYNHSVPSTLKAWLDRVCIVGRTFRYTATGPVGLLADKPVIIASSRGGIYSTPEAKAADFQEPYLVSILGLLGIHSITIIRAEGADISPDFRATAMAHVLKQIDAYFGAL